MAKQTACVQCGVISTSIKTKTPQGIVNMCESCNNEVMKDKAVRAELISYIAEKQGLRIPHPHSLKQLKDLHDKGYSYSDLLGCAKFYYDVEGNECNPQYAYTVAWMESRAIPNTLAYLEMMDLTMDELIRQLEGK